MVIRVFYSFTRVRVGNVSFATHLYLGKNTLIENELSKIFRNFIYSKQNEIHCYVLKGCENVLAS